MPLVPEATPLRVVLLLVGAMAIAAPTIPLAAGAPCPHWMKLGDAPLPAVPRLWGAVSETGDEDAALLLVPLTPLGPTRIDLWLERGGFPAPTVKFGFYDVTGTAEEQPLNVWECEPEPRFPEESVFLSFLGTGTAHWTDYVEQTSPGDWGTKLVPLLFHIEETSGQALVYWEVTLTPCATSQRC